MSAAADPLDMLNPERKLSGTTLVVLAFVTGTLFALLPMYYLYTSRDAGTRPAFTAAPSSLTGGSDSPSRAAPSAAPAAPARFAARMTYELSQTPAEPPPTAVRITAQAEPAPPRKEIVAQAQSARVESAARVQNARPIIASPPDPRDTTREMEREARRTDYREPPRQLAQITVDGGQSKVVEGRDFALPGKGVTTRPIAAPDSDRRAGEPSRTQLATVAVVPGATPIGRAPEAQPEPQPQKGRSAQGNDPQKSKAETSADVLSARLGATREWLVAAPDTTHTIQLMGSKSDEQMRSQVKALGKVLDPGKIYVFRTVAQGRPSMTLVYGSYADKQAALNALEKLPQAIIANKPVLRTVNGIRNEQKQHGSS